MLEVGFVLSPRSEVVNLQTSHLVSVSRQTEGPHAMKKSSEPRLSSKTLRRDHLVIFSASMEKLEGWQEV